MSSRTHKRGLLSLFLILTVALVGSTSALAQGREPGGFTAKPLSPSSQFTSDSAKADRTRGTAQSDLVGVIVKLKGEPLASYQGGVPGLPATSPQARGSKIDLKSRESQQYLDHLKAQRDNFKAKAHQAIPKATISHEYDIALNGVAMIVPADQVGALAALPDVEMIYRDELVQLTTDSSPEFMGAPNLWQKLGGQGSAGEGVIVGVLDTGIWPEHPSYSDPDPLGKPYPAPPAPISGTRQCEFSGGANSGPAFSCNNKLIGADRFMATYDAVVGLLPTEFTTARDDNGHGTHTSSTAAGNGGVAASIFGIPRGTISGIAPRAHVIMYKVCGDQGCFQSDSVAAIQKAIQDGVNVINFSIGGGNNPYADAVELAFLDAYNAGVFVAASAGNSGPGAETVAHRGPWVTTVGASTSDRHFLSDVTLTAGNGDTLNLKGASITQGLSTPAQVVIAGAAGVGGNALCTTAFPAGAVTGKIVICQLGPGRVLKSLNVLNGGGAGMFLINPGFETTPTDNHYVPTVHLNGVNSTTLLSFLGSHSGVMASFTQSQPEEIQGDVMTYFSSRGGPGQTLGVSKPDVTAPGIQILAGNTPQPATVLGGPSGQLFQAIQGTSMSSPHAAGSAALVKDLHPTWTPGQIKSALMTTAAPEVFNQDGVTPTTPFDDGSGRIALNKAGDPGVTFDVSGADYLTFKDQLYRANYPSLYIPSMPGQVTVQRTLRSVLSQNATWKLKVVGAPSDLKISVPSSINVQAGSSATFNITLDARNVPLGQTRFATLNLTSGQRALHFPIAIVRGQATLMLDKTCAPAVIPVNTNTACTLTLTNPTFDPASVSLTDKLPPKLELVRSSVTGGATPRSNGIAFNGTLAASQPANVAIGAGSSVGGYIPLSDFGIPPIGGMGDETITNFNVPAFSYAGETYTQLGVDSNGYLVVGGGTSADNDCCNNQNLPNTNRPNNVLAAFWTDLNPGVGGEVRIGTLSDGSDTWIVVDWAGVPEFSNASKLHSFEIWIGINSDAHPAEDISYAYGANTGNGDGGFLTVGAENRFGNRGQNYYYNGVGTLPSLNTELRVTTTPGTVSSHTITFQAKGVQTGAWVNYAEMTSPAFYGMSIARFSGSVTP